MKYEIERDGETLCFDIERQDSGYLILLNDGTEKYVAMEEMNGIFNLLCDGKSFDAGCVAHEDVIEVEVAGERHLISVVDPRKKALRLADSGGEGLIKTQMPGRIVEICVAEGEEIQKGQIVIIVEAMKMENPLKSSKSGVVTSIYVEQGQLVEAKTKLVLID